jgi:iron complex transport system substrate-binding protein
MTATTPDIAIVSLLPSTTEICFALGLEHQLRGVTHECDYPPTAATKPALTRNVLPDGEQTSADIDRLITERILNGQSIYDLDRDLMARLAPDLVLTQELCEVCAVAYDDVLALARTLPKVPRVASFEPRSVGEILDSIVEIARLAGAPKRGAQVVGALRERLAVVAERVAGAAPVRVLCLEWLDPPMVGGHWVPEMVALAGGLDVLGPLGAPSVRVSWSQIVASDPELVVLMPCGYDLATTLERARELDAVPAWRALPAVHAGRVFAVDGSGYFNRPGPRVIGGVELLARLCHPERCGELGPGDAGVRYSVTRL